MAEAILFLAGQFRESLAQRGKAKNRIVAEAARSAGRFEDPAIGPVRDYRQQPPPAGDRQNANEVRGAVAAACACQGGQQLLDVLLSCRLRPGVTRRSYARFAV